MSQIRKSLRQHQIVRLYGEYLRKKNVEMFLTFKKMGFDYILNPETKELHKVGTVKEFLGSHNLDKANLQNFIGLKDIGDTSIYNLPEGAEYDVYDLVKRNFICKLTVNKCGHCFKR